MCMVLQMCIWRLMPQMHTWRTVLNMCPGSMVLQMCIWRLVPQMRICKRVLKICAGSMVLQMYTWRLMFQMCIWRTITQKPYKAWVLLKTLQTQVSLALGKNQWWKWSEILFLFQTMSSQTNPSDTNLGMRTNFSYLRLICSDNLAWLKSGSHACIKQAKYILHSACTF